jgi:molybdenum cofactor biosynthesis enzyme MoaA
MMDLDKENNLSMWPLENIDNFIKELLLKDVKEIYVTGTNTDPLLYKHTAHLIEYLKNSIKGSMIGVRTNGVLIKECISAWKLYDAGSITICSLDENIYKKMMGSGRPPNLEYIVENSKHMNQDKFYINVVLGPENIYDLDVLETIDKCEKVGIKKINIREPYGQPHIGDIFKGKYKPVSERFGMPVYKFGNLEVTYWDVHYVEVESVNLYANGRVSFDYPISRGHSPTGKVMPQKEFSYGRSRKQWNY